MVYCHTGLNTPILLLKSCENRWINYKRNITEYRPDRTRYVGAKLVKKDGKNNITKQLPINRKAKEHLKGMGIEVRSEYDSIAEIQEMLDQLDGWHYAKEYIQEIEAVDDMFIEGIYEYIGENSDVFTKAEYH